MAWLSFVNPKIVVWRLFKLVLDSEPALPLVIRVSRIVCAGHCSGVSSGVRVWGGGLIAGLGTAKPFTRGQIWVGSLGRMTRIRPKSEKFTRYARDMSVRRGKRGEKLSIFTKRISSPSENFHAKMSKVFKVSLGRLDSPVVHLGTPLVQFVFSSGRYAGFVEAVGLTGCLYVLHKLSTAIYRQSIYIATCLCRFSKRSRTCVRVRPGRTVCCWLRA